MTTRKPMTEAHKQKLRAAALARKNAKNAVTTPTTPQEPEVMAVGGVEAELSAPVHEAPKSLLERIKQGIVKDETGKPKKKESISAPDSDADLIMGFLPLATSFLVIRSSRMWGPEYQPCAPSEQEVSAIITPLFRMASRSVQVTAKLTENGKDLLATATALMAYAVRSALLYIDINTAREKREAIDYVENAYQNSQHGGGGYTGTRSDQVSTDGAGDVSGAVSRRDGGGDSNESSDAIANSPVETPAQYARRTIAEAYMQDKQYRTEHGLL